MAGLLDAQAPLVNQSSPPTNAADSSRPRPPHQAVDRDVPGEQGGIPQDLHIITQAADRVSEGPHQGGQDPSAQERGNKHAGDGL